jgi:hypothetical protein
MPTTIRLTGTAKWQRQIGYLLWEIAAYARISGPWEIENSKEPKFQADLENASSPADSAKTKSRDPPNPRPQLRIRINVERGTTGPEKSCFRCTTAYVSCPGELSGSHLQRESIHQINSMIWRLDLQKLQHAYWNYVNIIVFQKMGGM